ncbi:MAG: hypothetical protein KGL35_25800 [Bradyrhizobium sp.]|nr:hypothetical protein [Bradyrhizobium sp.]
MSDDPKPPPGADGAVPAVRPPETFSREYVHELRQENAGYRLRASEAEKKANEATEAAKKAAEEAQTKVAETEKAAQLRVIRAEVKAFAVKAGIVDLDGLQLADLSKVTIDDKGEIVGAEAAIEALRKAKPYLFAQTTASGRQPPPSGKPAAKRATEMTPEEYSAAKRELLKR